MAGPAAAPRDYKFIVIDDKALSRQEAEARVLELLRLFGVKDSKSALVKKGLLYTPAAPLGVQPIPVQLTFQGLVDGARDDGVVPDIERELYLRTRPYGTMSLATDAAAFGGFRVSAGVRTSDEAKMPGYLTNDVVSDILEDVLHHRREVARTSTIVDDSYKTCFRAYRAYLSCCISAIDAFLNRRAWYARNDPKFTWTPAERNDLQNQRMSLTKKVEKWLAILAKAPFDKTTAAWSAFDQLRDLRNGFVHVNEPDYVFSLSDVASSLDLCREGVGGVLAQFMAMLGEHPSVGMSRVRYAPHARFVPMPSS